MKRPVIDPAKFEMLPSVEEDFIKEFGPIGSPERNAFIAESYAWYQEVCSQPDPEDEEDSSEASRPRILSSRLPRVAAL